LSLLYETSEREIRAAKNTSVAENVTALLTGNHIALYWVFTHLFWYSESLFSLLLRLMFG